jgi:aminoglycoside N3'-acetyltransferase
MNIKRLEKILIKSKIFDYKYVYIYSDLRYFLLFNKKNPLKFIKSFLDFFIKRNITLIVPTFSYTKEGNFYLEKTPSKLGFLPNYILKIEKGVSRSVHPLFSYASLGKNKQIVDKIGKSAFGKNSIHSKLYKNDCCYLYIGRPMILGNTMVHHIEHIFKAPYRFNKIFSAKVYGQNNYIGKNYSAYVRKDLKNPDFFVNFKKVYKKIKNDSYIFNYGDAKKFSNITIHPYDIFYEKLKQLYIEDNNIFINKS